MTTDDSTMSATCEPPMRLRAIVPWFGGKRRLAPLIVRQLGPHAQYGEPFCGSMAVLMIKPPVQQETVNDLHGDLTHLAFVLANPESAVKLYERLNGVLFSEAILCEAQAYLAEWLPPAAPEINLDRAFWFFIASWMGRNGTAGTLCADYQIAVRWTHRGGSPTLRFRHAVESIPAWHRRLQNVVILNRDALRILDRFEDDPQTAIYVDPPYPLETRNCHSGKGFYVHEFEPPREDLFSPRRGDHERLAEILHDYKRARIVLSSYDCLRIRSLYPRWTLLECRMKKMLGRSNNRGPDAGQWAPEILLINGPAVDVGSEAP